MPACPASRYPLLFPSTPALPSTSLTCCSTASEPCNTPYHLPLNSRVIAAHTVCPTPTWDCTGLHHNAYYTPVCLPVGTEHCSRRLSPFTQVNFFAGTLVPFSLTPACRVSPNLPTPTRFCAAARAPLPATTNILVWFVVLRTPHTCWDPHAVTHTLFQAPSIAGYGLFVWFLPLLPAIPAPDAVDWPFPTRLRLLLLIIYLEPTN